MGYGAEYEVYLGYGTGYEVYLGYWADFPPVGPSLVSDRDQGGDRGEEEFKLMGFV